MPKERTKSELLFDQYLAERGYVFEPQPKMLAGKTHQLDDRVSIGGADLYFDVKEFEGDQSLPPGTGIFAEEELDPYRRIFTKIKKASKQFDDYKEFSCSVVLYNNSSDPIFLEPGIVLGAMFGVMSWQFDESGTTKTSFGDWRDIGFRAGRMFDYQKQEPCYQHFSFVIVLEEVTVVPTEMTQMLDDQHRLLPSDYDGVAEAVIALNNILELKQRGIITRKVLRVVVYENPHASVHLPCDIFNGSYDERWGKVEETKIGKIFEGYLIRETLQQNSEADVLWTTLQRISPKSIPIKEHRI
ncbi:MAG: hypothetical protein HYR56_12095 [Acidobacteria bacterium]|nr:hypothetical protein [Acidobacteriota bacterium]MBI3422891.1 hypothetical protein [Acidobacteriota bacterium]